MPQTIFFDSIIFSCHPCRQKLRPHRIATCPYVEQTAFAKAPLFFPQIFYAAAYMTNLYFLYYYHMDTHLQF